MVQSLYEVLLHFANYLWRIAYCVFECNRMKLEPSEIQSQRELAELLPLLAHKAVTCKLTKTAQLINEAVKAIGWEIAERRESDAKTRKRESDAETTKSWEQNPDRSGGAFTAQEIADAGKWT